MSWPEVPREGTLRPPLHPRGTSPSETLGMWGSEWALSPGGIPGPIAFGWVIDKACLLWQAQCGQQGSCLLYQNVAMSRYMLIAGLGYKVSGCACRGGWNLPGGRGLGSPQDLKPRGPSFPVQSCP